MQLKSRPIQITKEDPFNEDLLDRRGSIEVLTQFLSSFNEPFVMGINSSWGTGKTTFIKMWQYYLEKNEFKTIYFNAWENDFADDPLVALIGEIKDSISRNISKKQKAAKNTIAKVKKAGSYLIKAAIPFAIKAATAGVVDLTKINGLSNVGEFIESIANEQIENYKKSKQNIIHFRKTLSEFIQKSNKGADYKPMVFFIDELDRCRPDFALQVLEKVKHLFNVDGIVFVLAIDQRQLINSIKTVYGADIDAYGYLRRFIDITYQLHAPEENNFVLELFKKYGFEEYFKERNDLNKINELREALTDFSQICTGLFHYLGFSLRVQEQCFSQFSIVFRATPSNQRINSSLLILLISLKNFNNELYYNYINGITKASDVVELLIDKGFTEDNYSFKFIKGLLYYNSQIKGEFEKTRELYHNINANSQIEEDKLYAGEYVNIFNSIASRRISHGLQMQDISSLTDKIELLSNFKD